MKETFRGYPVFYGLPDEDAQDFVETMNACCRLDGKKTPQEWMDIFVCVIRKDALAWFEALPVEVVRDPDAVRTAFLAKYMKAKSAESLWRLFEGHKQGKVEDFEEYKSGFEKIWIEWERSIRNPGDAADFLKRERFVMGLHPILKAKVEENEPRTYEEAVALALHKVRKIMYRKQKVEVLDREAFEGASASKKEIGGPSYVVPPSTPIVSAPPVTSDALEKLTQQIKELSIHMTQGIGSRPEPRREEGNVGTGRGRGGLQCWNCGERGHGMYNCPWPRGEMGAPSITYPVLRPGGVGVLTRQPTVGASTEEQKGQPSNAPLPDRNVNALEVVEEGVVECDANGVKRHRQKGKEPMEEDDIVHHKKRKEEKATTTKRRKRRIGLQDFLLGHGEMPYDIVDDLKKKGPDISWPQLLALCPKLRKELTKSVSTRLKTSKHHDTGVLHISPALWDEDVHPVVDCSIKGKLVHKVLIDGGAQICIMSD